MKRIIPVIGLLTLVVGCGTQADPRLVVNDDLRAKCPFLSDINISSGLSETENLRLQGLNASGQKLNREDECSVIPGAGARADCNACWVAIIDQVYGP